jgi:antitoxin ChpS
MYTTSLRKVGGSVMLAVPPAVLDLLNLQIGSVVALDVDGERLVVQPSRKPRYKLDDLLTQCRAKPRITKEDRQWIDTNSVGREL